MTAAATTAAATKTTDRPRRRRLPTWGAAVVASVLAASCTSAGASPATTSDVSTTVAVTTTTASTTTTVAPTTTVPVDGAAVLADAIAAYEAGYRFSSTATIGDKEVGAAAGIVVGTDAQLQVTSGDATVDYVITPAERWAKVADGDWKLLTDQAPPPSNPIEALADPVDLVVVQVAGDTVLLDATYPADRFGGGDGTLIVRLTIANGLLTDAGYALAGDQTTEVHTSFSPLQDGDAVTVPSA